MAEWKAEQYLKFKKQRTQPAIDLIKAIPQKQPKRILDIGCGPGNSTAVLKEYYPQADISGIDNSEDMIAKAKASYPDLSFWLCDVSTQLDTISEKFDIVFSNACLQWVPNHPVLIPQLMSLLKDEGILAVQIPMNGKETLYKIIDEVSEQPQWGFDAKNLEKNERLLPKQYYDILDSCAKEFTVWETTYYHSMPDHKSLVEWIKGTKLRPYINVLDETLGAKMEEEILKKTIERYPVQQNGDIIFCFRRFFFIATK